MYLPKVQRSIVIVLRQLYGSSNAGKWTANTDSLRIREISDQQRATGQDSTATYRIYVRCLQWHSNFNAHVFGVPAIWDPPKGTISVCSNWRAKVQLLARDSISLHYPDDDCNGIAVLAYLPRLTYG